MKNMKVKCFDMITDCAEIKLNLNVRNFSYEWEYEEFAICQRNFLCLRNQLCFSQEKRRQ